MYRKSKLKISEEEFKEYLLNHYVDMEGNKVSDRALWNSKKFFLDTGMYGINKYTKEMKMVSLGSVSYWKKKLNINEHTIFEYHKNKTKRIPQDIEFDCWSRSNNKGHKKIPTYTDDMVKIKLIKYANLPSQYKYATFDRVQTIACNFWENFGLNPGEELKKFYQTIKGGDE